MRSGGLRRGGRFSGALAPDLRTARARIVGSWSSLFVGRGLVYAAWLALFVACGSQDAMREQMRAIGRRSEELSAAIELGRLREAARLAGRAEALFEGPLLVGASHEPAWQAIRAEAVTAARRIRVAASRAQMLAAQRSFEAACWRCHDRYVPGLARGSKARVAKR